MRIWINWLSKTLCSVLFISGFTLYLTWVMVNTYADKLLVHSGSQQGTGQPSVKLPNDALPAWNQNRIVNKDSIKTRGNMLMSSEEFYKKKEQLSGADKMMIFNLVISKLPETEIQKISNELEVGITIENWTDIQNTVKKYLKPEE
jgi:hypothetical protein